ncbi:molecular chaperone DnaJ, partial [Nitrosococcus oceani]
SDPEKRRVHDEWIYKQRKKQEDAQSKKEGNKGENQEHERTQEEIERERARQECERQQAVARGYERRATGKSFNNVGATLITLAIYGYLMLQIDPRPGASFGFLVGQFIGATTPILVFGMTLGLLL